MSIPVAGYAPYPPYAAPRVPDRTAMIIVIVVVLVLVGSIGVSALMYVLVSGIITNGPPSPIAVGMTVEKSADGTNWTLIFTMVPANFNPSVAYLSLYTAGGETALSQMALTSLRGGMMPLAGGLGSVYLRYAGSAGNTVSAGDTISIGTSTSVGSSTTGYQVRIAFAASIAWSGTLQ